MSEKAYLCKYRVPLLVFMKEDQKIQADASNVLSIEKLDDYEFNLRSIIKISMRLDVRKKIWLMKNKRDITCKFELDRVGMDNTVEDYNTGSELIWNEEFGIYFNDEEEATDTRIMEERIAKNEGNDFSTFSIDSENYYESQNMLDVYLFPKKLLNASNNVFNDVLTEDTLQQFVGKLLTITKHPPKILISRFENDEVYKELLCPALPAYKALIYLDQYYGFYKKGSLIYYDVDCLYIINRNGKLTAKREGEWAETTIIATKLDSSMPGNGMIRKQGEKKFYAMVPENNINPQKMSDQKNAELGSEAKIVVTDDITVDIASADQSFIDQRNEQIAYKSKDDNKYSADMIKARMEENECVLYISGENLDIGAFTPNKTYNVVFEETSKQNKYGQYKFQLSYQYVIFRVESDQYMTCSNRITLKRAPAEEGSDTSTTGYTDEATKW